MIRFLFASVALFLAAAFQSAVLSTPLFFDARINLVLLLVVIWGALHELDEAVLWGLLGGAMLDLFSAAPFGTNVLTLGLIGFLSGWVGSSLRRTQTIFVLGLGPLAVLVYDILLAFVMESLGWGVDWPATVALVIFPGILLNSLATPIVYWIARRASAIIYPSSWP